MTIMRASRLQQLVLLFAVVVAVAVAFDDVPRRASGTKRKAATKSAPASSTTKVTTATTTNQPNAFEFALEHSLAEGVWTERGTVRVEFSQLSRIGSVKVDNAENALDKDAFQRLVARDGFYRVRLRRKEDHRKGGEDDDALVMSAARACALQASGFREMLTLHADVYGNVVALDYRTTITDCSRSSGKRGVPNKVTFKSRARLSMGSAGDRVVDTRVQEATARRAREESAEEKSFFQKYWMYIVPGVVIVLLQLVVPPEETQKAAAQQ